ncbi:DUF1700 domain-containing protein [Ectobacillus panaciterrae]|uniref:DUF1700 domain-containing protein n=1 Tax=Ectobacillus panaciterrae TaxID=363872 RepID=UPI00041F1EDE|nr:DUF1700 domain-containing protein [Ectobacillus panaciterrae]
MSSNGKFYLDMLYQHLRKLPEDERLDAVREIESHIVEGVHNGQQEDVILTKLGDPRKLAKAYRSEYILQRRSNRSVSNVFAMLGFYCTTGLLSVIVVPTLATLAYGFGFCTALIFIAGIIRSFGATWIQMDIGPNLSVPLEWSMIYALIVGGIAGSIAYFSWKYLRVYLNFLSASYRKVLPVNKK